MKVLLAGLGSIGQRHARNLRSLLGDRLELLAYRVMRHSPVIRADLTVDSNEDPEHTYDIRAFVTLPEALAARPAAVFITNPNHLHMSVALAAAEAGCHLFIEKPISHTLEGVKELAGLIERNRLVCTVGYQLRFHPALALLKSLMASRTVGTVIAAHVMFGEYLPGWHPYEDYRKYHAARKEQGGGVLLTQVHDLDVVYALFGMPRRVAATGGKLSQLEVDVEDTVDLVLESWVDGRLVPVHVHQDLLQRPPTRTYEIVGDCGRVVWDYYGNSVSVYQEDRVTPTTVHRFNGFERNQLFIDEVKHFLACIAGAARPVVSLREGVASLKIALAAKRSLETGTVVELDEE